MSSTTPIIRHWYFHCPECGFGDDEVGNHTTTDMIWCEICLEEKRYVRLRRWPVEDEPTEAPSRPLPGSGAPDTGFRGALLRRRTFGRGR
jgi:hypothetical protein